MEHMRATEKLIAIALLNAILAAGYTVSVNDGEEWTVKQSRDFDTIAAALATTGYDTLKLRKSPTDMSCVGSIVLIYGNDCDLLSDWSDNPAIETLVAPINDYADTLRT
ncbi:MAG: hypothetical protein V4649_19390 [Bacteroidota bacterium]